MEEGGVNRLFIQTTDGSPGYRQQTGTAAVIYRRLSVNLNNILSDVKRQTIVTQTFLFIFRILFFLFFEFELFCWCEGGVQTGGKGAISNITVHLYFRLSGLKSIIGSIHVLRCIPSITLLQLPLSPDNL